MPLTSARIEELNEDHAAARAAARRANRRHRNTDRRIAALQRRLSELADQIARLNERQP